MFQVIMIIDGEEYEYGTYSNRNKANEVALWLRNEDTKTYVAEVQKIKKKGLTNKPFYAIIKIQKKERN